MSSGDSEARPQVLDAQWFATTHWSVVRTAAPRAVDAWQKSGLRFLHQLEIGLPQPGVLFFFVPPSGEVAENLLHHLKQQRLDPVDAQRRCHRPQEG